MSDVASHGPSPVKMGNPAGFKNHQKCKHTSRRTGKPCQGIAMSNGCCRVHGGKALRGMANPNWQGGVSGRWKDKIPITLQESYERAVTDPNILELTEEIAVVDVRIGELLAHVTSGESTSVVGEMRDHWKMMRSAMSRQDTVSYEEAVDAMERLLFDNQEWRVWDDLFKAFKMRQSLVTQEQKRRMDIHAVISTEAAVGLLTEIMAAVVEEVQDEGKLRRIRQAAQLAFERRPNLKAAIGG